MIWDDLACPKFWGLTSAKQEMEDMCQQKGSYLLARLDAWTAIVT